MKKLLIAAMMVAGLAACTQEAKKETQEAASAVASDVNTAAENAASAVDAAASEAKGVLSKLFLTLKMLPVKRLKKLKKRFLMLKMLPKTQLKTLWVKQPMRLKKLPTN